MTTVPALDTPERPATPAKRTRWTTLAYWVVSAPVLLETAAGAQWNLTRNEYVREIFARIDFPEYFLTVLGTAKVLALIAILVPGFPRLKEWAYAGIIFIYLGALACHTLADDIGTVMVTPAVLAVLAFASWALRPARRRDPAPLYEALRLRRR